MEKWPRHPLIYEINTQIWLYELSQQYGRSVQFDTVPAEEIERIAGCGFDAVWLMGVWTRSPQGRATAMHHPDLRRELQEALPDLQDEDIIGSPYAVRSYSVDPAWGGDESLRQLRAQLAGQGLRLMLDFVPNHLATDHLWTRQHPDYFIQGSQDDLENSPDQYFAVESVVGPRILAHGRDPYFPSWADTAQLNYLNPQARKAMLGELRKIAALCDGLRCDMAMLVTNRVFKETWGQQAQGEEAQLPEFWPEATATIKSLYPGFLFMAEVYWDMEWELQQQGFDLTYDKTLYDRLRWNDPDSVRGHLWAEMDYQARLLRFIENHDELRALAAFGQEKSQAAAAIAATLPGACLFHDGQLEGRKVKAPVQLQRRREESAIPALQDFYRRLIAVAGEDVFREGDWALLTTCPPCDEADTCHNVIAYLWSRGEERRLVVVNLGGEESWGLVLVPLPALRGRKVVLQDLMGEAHYELPGEQLLNCGLCLNMRPYQVHVFEVSTDPPGPQSAGGEGGLSLRRPQR
jgi:hypothetical protein